MPFQTRHAGRDAYVHEERIRSAVEYRSCFAKTGASWRMMEFVLGIEYLWVVDWLAPSLDTH